METRLCLGAESLLILNPKALQAVWFVALLFLHRSSAGNADGSRRGVSNLDDRRMHFCDRFHVDLRQRLVPDQSRNHLILVQRQWIRQAHQALGAFRNRLQLTLAVRIERQGLPQLIDENNVAGRPDPAFDCADIRVVDAETLSELGLRQIKNFPAVRINFPRSVT